MNTLLYVSILLVIAHLTPPAGIIQVNEPGFETQEECHAWIDENRDEIMQNVLINFGPWADIKGVACLTEDAVKELNEKWGHYGSDIEDSPTPKDFLKQFEGGGA